MTGSSSDVVTKEGADGPQEAFNSSGLSGMMVARKGPHILLYNIAKYPGPGAGEDANTGLCGSDR